MTRIEITIGLLATVMTVLLILVYGANEETRMERRARAYDVRAVERGASAYEQYCSSCHGPNAAGGQCPPLDASSGLQGGDRGPGVAWRLEDLGVDRTGGYAYVYSVIEAGRQVSTRPWQWVGNRVGEEQVMAMPSWGEDHNGPLRPDQIADLAAYIMAFGDEIPEDLDEAVAYVEGVDKVRLSDAPAANPRPDGSDPVALGAWLFEDQACITCHAFEDVSDAETCPDLNDLEATAETRIASADYTGSATTAVAYIQESIVDPGAYVVDGYDEGVMPSTYSSLTDEEIAALIAYLTGAESSAATVEETEAEAAEADEEAEAVEDNAATDAEEEAADAEDEDLDEAEAGDEDETEAAEATATP